MIPNRILVPARLRRPPATGWSWQDRRFVRVAIELRPRFGSSRPVSTTPGLRPSSLLPGWCARTVGELRRGSASRFRSGKESIAQSTVPSSRAPEKGAMAYPSPTRPVPLALVSTRSRSMSGIAFLFFS